MATSRGLMGLKGPSMGYEGVLQMGGQQIAVKDGHFTAGGQQFFVSEDGKVTDSEDKPVAQVQDGKMIPLQQQQAPQQGAA